MKHVVGAMGISCLPPGGQVKCCQEAIQVLPSTCCPSLANGVTAPQQQELGSTRLRKRALHSALQQAPCPHQPSVCSPWQAAEHM